MRGGELASPIRFDATKVQNFGDFGQFRQPGLFHHFSHRLSESGVSVGGNLLADLYRLGDGGFILRISEFDPTTLAASKAALESILGRLVLLAGTDSVV